MEKDLTHWVHAFAGRRVLLVGDLILDRYLFGDAERISPEAPVPVLRTVESREAVGGSANVAACLRALGCEVVVCGVVGDDSHGETLRRLLEELGVNTKGVITVSDRPTTSKTRLVGLAQHRHRQQLLRVDEEDTTPLPEDLASKLAKVAAGLVELVDVVCIEDYDKGMITDKVVAAILTAGNAHDRRVIVDPARLSDYSRYKGADILTPNREELSVAVGRRLNTTQQVAAAAFELLQSQGFGAVVATVDREGAVVVTREGACEHLPTVPRSVYDNTGAGDAVLAMLAAAVAAGADLVSAARLANVAGGLEVEKFGCVPITTDEVLAELRLSDRLRNGKLAAVEEVGAELALRRDRGETVVFTNGCFDILHAGHVDFLRRCREEGSLLVVGLNSDDSVRALEKEGDRPFNRFEDRAAVLGALESVDYVVRFDEPTPEELIHKLRPDRLAKGEDWAEKGVVGRAFVESYGGRVVLLPLVEGLSTTKLIDRIRGERLTP
ncbi:MAG: bifunctional heptose 7-phosphate kinase/heptose 1-phosphate adenyltransferase [Planctomycetes bacterium]|nr:bifunctional heptose 7-phosphate kinase/heptose 1-phosphate adenyltransferase [Planctomycetota bacterium]